MPPETTIVGLQLVGIGELRRRWRWFLGLGILLVLLGTLALVLAPFLTLASMIVIGGALIVVGILQALHAFASKAWGGFFVDLLSGVLYLVVGFLMVANPGATAEALTLLIALFLIFGGIFRV